jgi:hypothetical protein
MFVGRFWHLAQIAGAPNTGSLRTRPTTEEQKRPALQAGALALRERIGVKFLYCRYLATYFATRSSNPLAMPCSAQPGFNREPSTWKVLCPNEASSGI